MHKSKVYNIHLIPTSKCGEAILVKFRAESEVGQNEVGDDED